LNKGELQQYSSADELYNKPRNLFVAGFIGSPPMNFIDCTLVEKEGNYYLDAGSFMVKLPIDLGKLVAEKATGPELVLGVRPEDLKISLKPTENSIESNVYVLEPLGKDTIVNVKLGDTLVKILAPPYIRLSIGDRIWIVYDLNKIHIFDKKTEKAIL
ncbi:MAG: sugar ABC transporter ATP-binding protein, partial [Thermoprotei archaeon]